MEALLDSLLQLAALVVLALGGLLTKRVADWLGLRADSEVRTYLLATLDRAVEFGTAEARRRIRDGGAAAGSAGTVAGELARAYVQDRVPDALARFGIDTPGLDAMIRARLPVPPRGLGG